MVIWTIVVALTSTRSTAGSSRFCRRLSRHLLPRRSRRQRLRRRLRQRLRRRLRQRLRRRLRLGLRRRLRLSRLLGRRQRLHPRLHPRPPSYLNRESCDMLINLVDIARHLAS